MIVCATVLLLGLAAIAVWSGSTIDLESILTALGGVAAGALGALGLKR